MRSKWFMRLSFVVVGAVLASGLGWVAPASATSTTTKVGDPGCLVGQAVTNYKAAGGCGPAYYEVENSSQYIQDNPLTGSLPPGISRVPYTTSGGAKNGYFTGNYTAAGRYIWNHNYRENSGDRTREYFFTIWDGPPVFASGAQTTSGTVGVNIPFESGYTFPFSQYPNTFVYSGLPPGMDLYAKTGVLYGTPTQAGTYTVSLSGSNSFGTASGTIEITIAPGAQTLSFTSPGAKAMSSTPFALNVTASSRLTPTVVSTTTSICSVDGLNLTMLGIGTCTLRASQAGNASYAAATDVSVSFSISKGNQAPLSITSVTGGYGSPITLTTSGGSGSGAVTFVVNSQGATGCSLTSASSTDLQFTAPGTCTVTATKALDSNFNVVSSSSTAIVIGKATQADLLLTSISGTFGTALPLVSSGGSGVGVVSFVVTSAGTAGCSLATSTSLTSTGGGTCSVSVSKALDTNYNAITSAITTVTFAVPAVAPSAPTLTSVTAGNARVTAAFTAGANGGSAILNYEYSVDGGTNWTPRSPASDTGSFDITGLTNGTSYNIKLRAVNAVGSGTASNAITATPVTIAAAPTNITVAYGHELANVTFTNGDNGGSPITDYEYSLDGGISWTARNVTPLSATITIRGLTSGVAHSLRLRSITAQGVGESSATHSIMVPVPVVTLPVAAIATGATSKIEGIGFVPLSDIRIEIHSTPFVLGSVQADVDGSFSTNVSIPAEFVVGNHHLVFVYISTGIQADSIPITIKAPAPSATSSIAAVTPSPSKSTVKKTNSSTAVGTASPTPEASESFAPTAEPSESPSPEAVIETQEAADTNTYGGWLWWLLILLLALVAYFGLRRQRGRHQ